MKKRYMSVPEVADYFSVSRSLVYRWIQEQRLEVWRPDSRPGTRGLRILSASVTRLEEGGKLESADFFR